MTAHSDTPPPHDAMPYRVDIDGLRGIAVLCVVLFHAGLPWLPGGFVGVDVFFVISGFLISRIIAIDVQAGNFSPLRFYRRRIKRLLPAFTLVTLSTVAAAYLLLLPVDLRNFGQSVAMAGLFATNILFWLESGYFTQLADTKPLLHSWSLGVEEQFYFLYPVILILGLRASRRWGGIAVTAVILILSFAASAVVTGIDRDAAFYLLPTRAWELMFGSMLALVPLPSRWRENDLLVALGLAMIAWACISFSGTTPFPGVAAAIPVLGAGLVIGFGGGKGIVVRAGLQNPLILFFGRISYSLYLWHWPLLAFARYRSIDVLDARVAAVLMVMAVMLAWLSWRFVEQPLRRHDRLTGWRPFAFAAGSSAVMVALGCWFVVGKGLPYRIDPDIRTVLATARGERRAECLASEATGWRDPKRACTYGAAVPPSIAMWGDSHARAIVEGLGVVAREHGRSVALYGYAGCAPMIGLHFREPLFKCAEYSRATMAAILANPAIRTVVIAARHGIYLRGLSTDLGPAERGKPVRSFLIQPLPGLRTAPRVAAYEDRLGETVRILQKAGRQVILIAPVPEVGFDVPRTIAIEMAAGRPPRFDHPRAAYERRQAPAFAILRAVATRTGAIVVPTVDLFCDKTMCHTVEGRNLLYYDDNHVSPLGSKKIAQVVWKNIVP
jgi:peptidoglycan/LPS O-acetylase OafA/YrhL